MKGANEVMRRPTKCPICGNKIVKVTNAVTKKFLF